MSELVLTALKAKFGASIVETHSEFGDDTAVVDPAAWKAVCQFLRDDPQMGFDMPVDLCGVDFLDYPHPRGKAGEEETRFEVVLHLYSIARRHRVRVKARIGDMEGENAEIASVTDVWAGVNWYEREVFDLMGITFTGHPDLRRILMYPEFEGAPLRKDYPANKTQPLVAYRTEEEAGRVLEKLPPFGPDEGMPFGRNNFTGVGEA